jgi:mannose-6-phosphate isomerase-like protein (cupin superfamily)
MEDFMKRLSMAIAAALCATAALAGPDKPKVNFVPATKLLADIRKAPPTSPNTATINYLKGQNYAAMVARRTAPDRSEVHKTRMDIWYVVEGGGTLVTGGSLVEPTETEPNELRGSGISGGDERRISKGDFVTIPAGVPHWIRSIDGKEIIYLVVKVAPSAQ